MRWSSPRVGDTRTRKKFCWWPFEWYQDKQRTTYWLEFIVLKEEYQEVHGYPSSFEKWLVKCTVM